MKFLGVKDFATFQALDELGVIMPGDNTNFWMFADRCHRFQSDFGFEGSPIVPNLFVPEVNSFVAQPLQTKTIGFGIEIRKKPKQFRRKGVDLKNPPRHYGSVNAIALWLDVRVPHFARLYLCSSQLQMGFS